MRATSNISARAYVAAAEPGEPAPMPLHPGALRLTSVAQGAPERAELESFVSAAFRDRHAARLRTFMPTLLGFRDGGGRLRGVVGLRPAQTGRLYLEQYLDMPVEAALTISGCPAVREDIVEVGNLAAATGRTAMRMVAQLPAHLLEQRYRWIVFTATRVLRDILASFDAPLVEIASATRARLANATDDWGRYYATDPRVLAGYLPDSRRIAAFADGSRSH